MCIRDSYTLNAIYDRYRIPLMVVENGLGAYDKKDADGKIHDSYRIDYLRAHIQQMAEAVKDGVDLIDVYKRQVSRCPLAGDR